MSEAIGAIAGSIISGLFSARAQAEANSANRQLAAQQMAFQAGMTDLSMAYGREMVGRQEQYNNFIVGNQQDFTRGTLADQMGFQREMLGRQEQWNEKMVTDARNWDQYMQGTAYQRAMADMRSAGLNPMLAYQQGGAGTGSISLPGVSPGSGGSGSSSAPGISLPSGSYGPGAKAHVESIGGAVHTAMQGSKLFGELKQLYNSLTSQDVQQELGRSQARATDAQTLRTLAETDSERERPAYIRQQSRNLAAQIPVYGAQVNELGARSGAHTAAAEHSYASAAERSAAEALANQEYTRRGRYGTGRLGAEAGSAEAVGRQLGGFMGWVGRTFGGGSIGQAARRFFEGAGEWTGTPFPQRPGAGPP